MESQEDYVVFLRHMHVEPEEAQMELHDELLCIVVS